jgi:hypothetical protein
MQVTQAMHRLVQQEPDRPLTVYGGRVRPPGAVGPYPVAGRRFRSAVCGDFPGGT